MLGWHACALSVGCDSMHVIEGSTDKPNRHHLVRCVPDMLTLPKQAGKRLVRIFYLAAGCGRGQEVQPAGA